MTPTLYLTRNGLLEPLGQSQIMAYLRGLSKDHAITYEMDEDRADTARMQAARIECERRVMVWRVWREVRRPGIRLIHCRSYIPVAVGLVVSRLTGLPFILDMRTLRPEKLITAGRQKRHSMIHYAIVAAERACLRRAAGVVSLTWETLGAFMVEPDLANRYRKGLFTGGQHPALPRAICTDPCCISG